MAEKVYHYPVWLRLWHILNALMFLMLILSGLSMQYSTPDNPFIRFDIAVKIHDIGGITVTINYLFFLIANYASGNSRHYKIAPKGALGPIMKQARFYALGIFKGEHHPFPVNKERKFNPLQKTTYIFTMYFGMPLLVLSGLSLFFPAIFDLLGIGSLIVADVIHVLIGIILTMFMIVHIYFCTIGHTPTSNFKSMISGYHDVEE